MEKRKHLSIGVTVNLEHYENLRLEVSGELDRPGDADELVAFLDQILGTLGRGDAATAERVDSYRRRVFTYSDSREMTSIIPSEFSKMRGSIPKKQGKKASTDDSPLMGISGPATPTSHKEESCPEERGIENGSVIPLPSETVGTPPAVSREERDEVCEICGSRVSRSEKKMSELFASRILCKKCIRQG